MALHNRTLVVGMDASEHGEAGEFTVQLRLGDQLRAELEAKKIGLDATKVPIHLQSLFGWAAMVREGKFSGPFKSFRDVCEYVEGAKGDDDGDVVDPTDQGQSSA